LSDQDQKPHGNADYPWTKFDSEAYFSHYYRELHPDDIEVIQRTVAALKAARPAGDRLSCVDVGTGPNLFPLLAAMPRAAQVTAWEYAPTNIEWLRNEMTAPEMRRQLREFWDVIRQAWRPDYDLPAHPYPALQAKAALHQGSIFDLPARQWDAGTMFFCADSITQKMDEFERACTAYARSVKTGGTLACAFLLRSGGYEVAGQPFPVLRLTTPDVTAIFEKLAADLETHEIGMVEEEIRSGYLGMLFVTGRAR
jgi:hypothetical protein